MFESDKIGELNYTLMTLDEKINKLTNGAKKDTPPTRDHIVRTNLTTPKNKPRINKCSNPNAILGTTHFNQEACHELPHRRQRKFQ